MTKASPAGPTGDIATIQSFDRTECPESGMPDHGQTSNLCVLMRQKAVETESLPVIIFCGLDWGFRVDQGPFLESSASYRFPLGATNMAGPDDRWLSVDEICKHLGVSKDTVYRWIDKQKMPAHRVGRLWKFKKAEVDDWVTAGGAADNSKRNKTE
jgi:excisionase family DNA binding protein